MFADMNAQDVRKANQQTARELRDYAAKLIAAVAALDGIRD